jgi:ribonuclease G
LAEWLYEAGIGENRAILVEYNGIAEAVIELPGQLRVGEVVDARLTTILIPARRGLVTLADGDEALLEPLPAKLTEGQTVRIEVIREPVAEDRLHKRAKVRSSDAALRDGPNLRERLQQSGLPFKTVPSIGTDVFEELGWSELLETAHHGDIAFEGGALRMSLTPTMTLFDVDGFLPPTALAIAGTRAAGLAIRRLGIAGSIGIDLPTLEFRSDRQAAANALDEVLPQPFERTAVNGFGFLQIVRKRERASLPELVQGGPAAAAARALLRRAERSGGSGERTIVAAPAVIALIRDDWRLELERRIGASVALRPDVSLAISAGHVHSAHP